MNITIFFLMLNLNPIAQEEIHPALIADYNQLIKIWDKGYSDARTINSTDKVLDVSKKTIGHTRISPLKTQDCSWIWWVNPKMYAYLQGYLARKQYWGDEETAKSRWQFKDEVYQKPYYLFFYGEINELPGFGAPYGKMDKPADIRDLMDVRVVLKVGEKIYQPLQHPGDLTISKGEAVNYFSFPVTTFGKAETYVWGKGNVVTNYQELTFQGEKENYTYYSGTFAVAFELYDKKGKPIITKEDKEFTVIVVQRSHEAKATYSLEEWVSFKSK